MTSINYSSPPVAGYTPPITSGTITSTGLGSGLDINGLVSQLMAVEAQPIQQLNAKTTAYQAQLTAYGTVKSALSAFQSAVTGLESATTFQTVAATSGDTSSYTATAGPTAVPGNYSVQVINTAQSQTLMSGAFATVNDVVGTGTLTFQFGTAGAGGFTANAAKAARTVTIGASNNTLAGVRDAINAAKIGVSATIINDGTGNRLSLTSTSTGAANSLKITVSGDADGNNLDNSGLSQLAYDPAGTQGNGRNLSQTVQAKDALLTVNGLTNIAKPSNQITDLIQGVTLNLLQSSTNGASSTLSVANDPSSVQKALQNFVGAYNGLQSTLATVTAYDPTTQTGAVLLGDSTTLMLEDQLRSMLNTTIPGLRSGSSVQSLSDIGISFQKDGTLALDTSKLQAALNTNSQDVASLFATVGTASDGLISYTGATSATQVGSYAVNVSQLASQGTYNGAGTAALANSNGTFTTPVVIDSTNNTLALQVDGVQTATVTLAQGSYSTAAALAAEIQSEINGDSALSAAGSSVTVGFDNSASKLSIASNKYGSASSVAITAVGTNSAASLGLSAGAGTTGVDVAGTINGVQASGSGQYLTGALGNASSGLKIQILGGVLGSRGTVNYSQGYANQIDTFVGNAIGANGPISARTDGINQSVSDIKNQVTTMNQNLALLQQQYLSQFNAMDTLVAQFKSTSDFLTQALASLSNITPTGK